MTKYIEKPKKIEHLKSIAYKEKLFLPFNNGFYAYRCNGALDFISTNALRNLLENCGALQEVLQVVDKFEEEYKLKNLTETPDKKFMQVDRYTDGTYGLYDPISWLDKARPEVNKIF